MENEVIIEFRNASIFQKTELILTNVNLSLEKGDFVYLIGKVGSGKSSLVKTIIAELPLKLGEGKIGTYDLLKIKRKEIPFLRRKIGVVFQDMQLLIDRNVHDNLQFVLKATGWNDKREIEERINDVLEKVELRDKKNKKPHELSGGEQQRVVVARALLNDPEIILADEPTGNLDPDSSAVIVKLLQGIARTKRVVIMATHDYPMIKQFPARILKCADNKLFEISQLCDSDELLKE